MLTKLYDQEPVTLHTGVESNHGDPLSTLFSNTLLQHMMKPRSEKWNKDSQGVRLAEDHHQWLTQTRYQHVRRAHHNHSRTHLKRIEHKMGSQENTAAAQGMSIHNWSPESENQNTWAPHHR